MNLSEETKFLIVCITVIVGSASFLFLQIRALRLSKKEQRKLTDEIYKNLDVK